MTRPSIFLAVILVAAAASAQDKQRWYSQVPQVAPSAGQPAPEEPAPAADQIGGWYRGPAPVWIWGKKTGDKYQLRTTFTGGSKTAKLIATCDNVMTVKINGKQVASSNNWEKPVEADITKYIIDGENTIVADVANEGGIAGFLLKMILVDKDGKERYVVSDDSWKASAPGDDLDLVKATVVHKLGRGPWGDIFAGGPKSSGNREAFNLLPGFQAELLFTVPKAELGSWVSITTDDRGRLIVSDQGGEGLCRITPSPIGSKEPTKIERLDVKISGAHSMLTAFGSLYVCVNGQAPGSGLYRLRDTDGDDQYDEVQKLKDFKGGGEHGPHGLRLSPHGKFIYAIGGNHTKPPFELTLNAPVQTMGGVRPEQLHAQLPEGATSRIIPNWDEDVLLPRQWDANGHATGILAPGGWIARTDPDGKTWEMMSVGYRNQYDMAFNADGELFAYDSDMEWDMGTPWYRATRVTHATSGSEFGWRSGTADWPWYYVDSLPPLIDIGPGSPVGVEFGYGTKFPAKYQKALMICDWTFGTMYAIHLEPDGASYKATKEEFLSRTPLPLTDATVGKDGALYFTVGGRGTQSELYRVTYVGSESTAPVDARDQQGAELRSLRREIESFHTANTPDPAKAVKFLVPHLAHSDMHIRYAARVALERIPVKLWQEHVLAASDTPTIINGVVGLARAAEPDLRAGLLASLAKLDLGSLSEMDQLGALRAYQLVLIRLGLPDEKALPELGKKFEAVFPTSSENVNRELAVLMVGASSPNAAHILVPFLTKERKNTQEGIASVLARNGRYGGSISAMLANQPDQFQLHVALTLRNLKKGWTLDEKKTYFSWFEKARAWSGGNSYQKFLINIDKDAYENSTDVERLAVEALGVRKPYKAPELPKPKGPGKEYTLADLMSLSTSQMSGRDFNNGRKMYAAARCVICHRFGGEGGSTGPDLTQAAGRFNFKDLSEAIVDPSKVVSDQYRTTVVVTEDGKSYTGRIVSLNDKSITLLIDPEDATKTVEIAKDNIEDQKLSPVSLMPKDLLKPLNEAEALDLLAYLLSRGNPQDPMFKK